MDTVSYSINHNVNYYMRNAYRGNTNAITDDYRGSQPKAKIISADARAVKRMAEKLNSLEYDSDHGPEVLQNAKAFVKTYNNLIESTEDDLASIGIELKGNGSLTLDEDKFGEARPAKIEEILSSKGNISVSLRSIANKIFRQSGKMAVYTSSAEKTAQDAEQSGKTVDLSL